MKLIIHRQKKFASFRVPYYVVFSESREGFLKKYDLSDDNRCELTWSSFPVPRARFDPAEYNIPIESDETLELEIPNEANCVFVMTAEGLLSNEIMLDQSLEYAKATVSTKGGWSKPSYPALLQE